VSRRTILKAGALGSASLAVPWRWLTDAPAVRAATKSQNLRKFIQPLRGVGGRTGVPVAVPDKVNPSWVQPGATHYTIDILQFSDQLHPDLPNPTRLWGFGQPTLSPVRHLGGIIAAKKGAPVQITFRNKLPAAHLFPVDRTIMGTEGQDNRTDVHLHGGYVPWTSDGGPFAWWDPNGHKGPSFVNNSVLGVPNPSPNQAEYYYPNDQSARLVWYHDHSIGITRLNAYAGIASGYVIYDDYELALAGAPSNVPGPLDPRTLYMVFQDKVFVSKMIQKLDPTWMKLVPASKPGDLWYAHIYDPADREDPLPQDALPLPNPSCVPEFFGDTILVNGTVYPFLEVEQRQYRLRLLNACNSRFLNPRVVYAAGTTFPNDSEPGTVAGPAFVQFGSEGGFLPAPVYLSGQSPLVDGGPTPNQLLLAPAERADLIVDFSNVPAGARLLLVSDARAPYPEGDGPITSIPGYGPDTRTLLQIRVKARKGLADPLITLPGTLTPTDPFLISQTPGVPTPDPAGVPVRRLTLNETFDAYGRLIQFLGTDTAVNSVPEFGREYVDRPTEIIQAGTAEVWEILNLTGDTHPIHFHLVNVQVLSRQQFDAEGYTGGAPGLIGNPIAPDDNELGWKETVRMNPAEVTRVHIKFTLPAMPFTVPASPRLLADYGIAGGAEYVWHCHILEHEEHDMMRPLVVV
jgi:spore coat protein A